MTPQTAQAQPRDALALQLQQAFAARDVNAICRIGKSAHQLGDPQLAGQACAAAVSALNAFISRGDAEAALFLEWLIYDSFVKAVEDEDHYERVFSGWREPMAALGRRFREARAPAVRDAKGIGFIVPSGVVLGHTEVVFRLLENRERDDVRLYIAGPAGEEFLARAAALGVPVQSSPHPAVVDRLRWLRERLAADAVGSAVWVSVPSTAIFALAMGLAPIQVMWSLRYHPVRLPEIDGYLTYGSWGEESRVFHGQRWVVCPVPLALDPRLPAPGDVAALRARFPHKVLLGTLAREEKLDSRPFLQSVAEILRRNPECGYLWTGREPHPGISSFFQREGLADRCHFVGWVDTPLYAAILDVFLETFPLGCGITGYQALAAGVPLVSYLDANTVFGMQYWSGLMARAGDREHVTREMLDEYPVLCARDPQEYAALVSRLVADPAFRDQWRARESRFFDEEIAGIARYSKRFFAAIGDVAARKAA